MSVAHSVGSAEAVRRLLEKAEEHGLEVKSDDGGTTGSLATHTPLGDVRAHYRVTETTVEVELEKKPAFVPEGLIRRKVEEGLQEVLG